MVYHVALDHLGLDPVAPVVLSSQLLAGHEAHCHVVDLIPHDLLVSMFHLESSSLAQISASPLARMLVRFILYIPSEVIMLVSHPIGQ